MWLANAVKELLIIFVLLISFQTQEFIKLKILSNNFVLLFLFVLPLILLFFFFFFDFWHNHSPSFVAESVSSKVEGQLTLNDRNILIKVGYNRLLIKY